MLTAQIYNQGSADKKDWKLCVICQQSIKEKLWCPTKSKRQDKEAGYKTLGEHLKQFDEIDCLPDINLSHLDEGDGIVATLSRHKASFHKTCYDRFNSTQLKRAQKRRSEAQEHLGARGSLSDQMLLLIRKILWHLVLYANLKKGRFTKSQLWNWMLEFENALLILMMRSF